MNLPDCSFELKVAAIHEGHPLDDYSEPHNSWVELTKIIHDAIDAHPDLVSKAMGDEDSLTITIELEKVE